jgi:chromosome segregation ATPase
MADTTWGVKVPEELKERLSKAMQDADLSGKEFVETLLQTYELNMVKQSQYVFSADIEELQALTGRINMIYVNLAERIETLTREKEAQFQVQIESKESVLRVFDSKNKELQQIIDEMKKQKDELGAENIELVKRIQELEEIGGTNKALVQEYKEKNDTLAGLLNEYKEYKTENDSLKEKMHTERQKLLHAEDSLKETWKSVRELTQKIEDMKSNHSEEMEKNLAKSELEKEKAILELRNEYQTKISSLHDHYSKEISTLQREYNAEVKLLLSRIDDLQTKVVAARVDEDKQAKANAIQKKENAPGKAPNK